MAVTTKFKLPDVGEGLTEAELLSWSVQVGDTVEINQVLCEIETAKSAVELPSPVAGTVEALHVEEGQTVEVGTVLISFRQRWTPTSEVQTGTWPPEPGALPDPTEPTEDRTGTPDSRPRDPAPGPGSLPQPVADEPEVKILVGTAPSKLAARRRHLRPRGEMPTPPLRRAVGPHGADVPAIYPTPQATETRVPIKGVRKAVAAAMTASAFTAPHATEWLTVDVTETMRLVRLLKSDPRWEGIRVNPMLFVAKALLLAVERHPVVNAQWDEPNQEIVLRDYVNLGIAAATPRGLIVPNIKSAQALGFTDLARAIDELVDVARAGKTTPAQMSRGTITITNIGALGVDAGIPILNPGEAAILALGAIRATPWVVDDEIVVRQVAQLTLSFDHRLVDGELAAQVLCDIASVLAHPVQSLLHTSA
ncbi:dihydrolipoamide acetyltransferase family protein [Nocardia jinanensis]|uniref:Dihydrolipoamide acetyltransferase component of pyruvate dehydrogenase complex n=1 Tax=Nocardia jinanensis TaxID=382504 RepID=A0A917VYT7_9NOCA|nr:dihydrolipoamide acetyltransferase family protein [Nocardia jinanensis]GGL40234.1 dihydrolipoamide acetyltransferase component of pyruvate dehydrogenase complex [Nocardia jinanensis]